ncbi:hypothetical protein E2C01_102602 [Portunus trituberculatus]|uniref:Uncharacterized protein n=1 Tax=Portunus trituberculatus TaxID=210409 RepID=A0A5B7KIQ6_PORTR|nr:hypothetical protein [Portunus trituberculatus]
MQTSSRCLIKSLPEISDAQTQPPHSPSLLACIMPPSLSRRPDRGPTEAVFIPSPSGAREDVKREEQQTHDKASCHAALCVLSSQVTSLLSRVARHGAALGRLTSI